MRVRYENGEHRSIIVAPSDALIATRQIDWRATTRPSLRLAPSDPRFLLLSESSPTRRAPERAEKQARVLARAAPTI
jgi:hypothetical protein